MSRVLRRICSAYGLSFVALFIALGAGARALAVGNGPSVTHATTGPNAERVATLPIAGPGQSCTYQVVYSVPVSVVANDTLKVLAEFRAKSPYNYNIDLSTRVVLTSSPTATTGSDVTEGNAFNITAESVYGHMVDVGTRLATSSDAGERYVNILGCAASVFAQAGEAVQIVPGAGEASVISFRDG